MAQTFRDICDQDVAMGTIARLCCGVEPPDGRSKRRARHGGANRTRKKGAGNAAKELRRIRKESGRIMRTLTEHGKRLARIEKAV